VKLKSVELVNALSAEFEQLNVLTQTSVNINQNVVKAEQGNFLLFASFFDTFYVEDGTRPSDALFFGYFKTFEDASAVADLAAKSLIRGVSDSGYVVDSEVIRFVKGEFEQVGSVDTHSFDFGKDLADLVSGIGDQVFIFAKKFPEDPVGVAEAVSLDASLVKGDTTGLQDEPALATAKPIAEIIASAGDQAFLFAKKFPLDQVTALDDIATIASAKALTDQPISTDNDIIAFAKALVEHGYISEAIDTLNVGKVFADVSAASDVINTFGLGKNLGDTVGFTDDVDGTASTLDDQEMQFHKTRTHVASVSEVFERQVDYTRAFTNSSNTSDSTNMVTGKHIYDIPVASETLAKSLARLRSDSALLGDATVVTAGKVLLDLTSSTDTGSLRSQGYSDFTYFAEDFVGASTTF
jgi:hypothetical protein